MGMQDEQIERLGNYFVAMNICDRYGITFEQFTILYSQGIWEDFKITQNAIQCVGCES